jgi:hypothetical protein
MNATAEVSTQTTEAKRKFAGAGKPQNVTTFDARPAVESRRREVRTRARYDETCNGKDDRRAAHRPNEN